MKKVIDCECPSCNEVTKHDFDSSVSEGIKTTITVCKECGYTYVDHDPDDLLDFI